MFGRRISLYIQRLQSHWWVKSKWSEKDVYQLNHIVYVIGKLIKDKDYYNGERFFMIKRSINQKDIAILNVFVPNHQRT